MTPWLLVAVLAGAVVARVVVDLAAWLWRHRANDEHREAELREWEWAAEHRSHVHDWFIDVHEHLDAILDAILANSADQGGRHGVTGQTGFMSPLNASSFDHAPGDCPQRIDVTARTDQDTVYAHGDCVARTDAHTAITGWAP